MSGLVFIAVRGFPGYFINRNGEVRGPRKTLKLRLSTRGYPYIIARGDDGKWHWMFVHTIMLNMFRGPKPTPCHQARHWNGDKADNQIDNLFWGTPKENADDKRRHGTDAIGERHPRAKLTNEQVIEIRKRRANGATIKELCAEFGLTNGPMSQLSRGIRWAHICQA